MTATPRAWIVRAGSDGEREAWCLENGMAGGGWRRVPDLTRVQSRHELRELLEASLTSLNPRQISGATGQLWRFAHEIQVGDTIAMPLKTARGQVALGRVNGGYVYRDDPDETMRHFIRVDWIRPDTPKSEIGQDVLFSLGSLLTICGLEKSNAAFRLKAIMEGRPDPGALAAGPTGNGDEAGEDGDELETIDQELLAIDAIRARIEESFSGHRLATLVAEILKAKGFTVRTSDPGPDGGKDVLAGRGLLGLDSPRIVVQVKSNRSSIDAPTVRELQGVAARYDADQALFVAWSGLTRTARDEAAREWFKLRIWDSEDIVRELLDCYEDLPGEIQAEIPLKRIWTLTRGGPS